MTRDASDWDPLPVEETGLHPGEAQAKLRKPEHAPIEASVQGFAVVRTSAPGSAVATTRSAPTVRARTDQPIPSKPIVDAAAAPYQSLAQADLLMALQRSRSEMALTQVPALPLLREKPIEPKPVASSEGLLQHEAKPMPAPRQVVGPKLANAAQPSSTAKQSNASQPLAIAQPKAMVQATLPFSFDTMTDFASVTVAAREPLALTGLIEHPARPSMAMPVPRARRKAQVRSGLRVVVFMGGSGRGGGACRRRGDGRGTAIGFTTLAFSCLRQHHRSRSSAAGNALAL
jgi:hypothetical protein